MAEVIKVNFKLAWKMPVYVRLGDGFREKVTGPTLRSSSSITGGPNVRVLGIARPNSVAFSLCGTRRVSILRDKRSLTPPPT